MFKSSTRKKARLLTSPEPTKKDSKGWGSKRRLATGRSEAKDEGLDWNPVPYMVKAMKWIVQNSVAGLLLDPGLRKTSITLGAFSVLLKRELVDRMLVIAPVKVAFRVWPKEARKWKDFHHLRVLVLHGKNKSDESLRRDDVDIFVINPEGLDWLFPRKPDKLHKCKDKNCVIDYCKDKELRAEIMRKQKEEYAAGRERAKLLFSPGGVMLAVDESSKFKNQNSQRFKALEPWLPKFARRLILTGSPAPRSYLDLFAQVYIIDLGRALGRYITQYRKRYFENKGFGGYDWVLREGADEEIHKAVKPYMLRLQAEDYIDLPVLIENDIVVDMPDKARAIYDELEEDLIAILDSGKVIEAPTAGAALAKCAQVANGAIYLDPDDPLVKRKVTDFEVLHDEKLYALEDYLEERNRKPTLVTYEFKHDLIRIRKHLRGMFPELVKRWGDIPCISTASEKVGQIMEDAWNNNEIELLLGQPQSISHGLNMQGGDADALGLFSPMYDYDVYDQLIRRLRRSGNKAKRIVVTRFVTRDTVDRLKIIALVRKGKQQMRFTEAMKRYKSERGM